MGHEEQGGGWQCNCGGHCNGSGGGEGSNNNNKEMDDKNKGVVDNKEDYNIMVAVVAIVSTITIITTINTINTITPRYC